MQVCCSSCLTCSVKQPHPFGLWHRCPSHHYIKWHGGVCSLDHTCTDCGAALQCRMMTFCQQAICRIHPGYGQPSAVVRWVARCCFSICTPSPAGQVTYQVTWNFVQTHQLVIHTFKRSRRRRCLWRPQQLILGSSVSCCLICCFPSLYA